MPPRPEDPTEAISQVPGDTARMPSASDPGGAPPEPPATNEAPDAPMWAAAGHAPGEPVAAPAAMGAAPAAAGAAASKGSWWKGRMAIAAAALVTGLGLGAAVGGTAAVAIDRGDEVSQVGEADRGGFPGEGRPPGGRHGEGQLPGGEGQLPGGEGQLPGGGTSTDPGDANGTDQAT